MNESGRRVVIAPAAQRQLRRRPPGEAARLRGPILALGIHPHPPGAARLTSTDFWRLRIGDLRIGDLRIVYLVEDGGSVVILRVARRSERTYRQPDR